MILSDLSIVNNTISLDIQGHKLLEYCYLVMNLASVKAAFHTVKTDRLK
jgi:hypothetical protein